MKSIKSLQDIIEANVTKLFLRDGGRGGGG